MDYDKLILYAKSKIYENRICTSIATSPEDCVSAGFVLNSEFPKKGILNYILTEKRKELARMQYLGIIEYSSTTKICDYCKVEKEIVNFDIQLDTKTGYRYPRKRCQECDNKYRREKYATDTRAKKLAHKRYLKFKAKKDDVN